MDVHAAEIAGATVRDRSGWSASLFVAPPPEKKSLFETAAPVATAPIVNASVSRRLRKDLRLSFDVSNVLDRHLPGENYLFQPAEPRGFRLQLQKTW